MKHNITIGEPYKYISSHAISGIEDLEKLLISTKYYETLTFEQGNSGEVLSWIMWQGNIESILEEIEETEEKTQDGVELASILEALLNAMQEAEIEFILIDRT